METQTKTKEYNIDAKDKKLGRLASEIAVVLMGKDSLDFARNKVSDVKVNVSNASKIDISTKKLTDKRYKSFSGYPSGLKIRTANEVIKVHGYSGLIERTVKGMLPGNKLRSRMLKNLHVAD
jgi:large subunit ribosomal protein L13